MKFFSFFKKISIFDSLIKWTLQNSEQIIYIIRIILTISFIFFAFSILTMVLLQRGEDGAFSKNKGDKSTADNKTLFRGTVVFSILFFINAVFLTGLIHQEKHQNISKNQINISNKV